MRVALIICLVGFGIIAALFSRFAGLLLYLWFAFFRPQEFVWGEVDALRLSLLIGMLLVVPSLLTGVWPNLKHPIAMGMIGFFLTAVVAQVNALNVDAGMAGLDQLGRAILVALFAITILSTRERLMIALGVVAVSLGFHGAKIGAFYLAHGAVLNSSIGGMFSDNNDVGLAVSRVVVPLFGMAVLCDRPWLKLGFLVAAPAVALGVIATYSRGAFLGLTASVLVYFALTKRRVAIAFLVITGVAAVPMLRLLPQSYVDRLSTITANKDARDKSAEGRLHFWHVAELIAIDRPFGVGLRNFPYAYDRYDDSGGAFGQGRAVHSSHFQVLAETGFPGLIFWIGLNIGTPILLLRIRKRAKHAPTQELKKYYLTMTKTLMATQIAFLVGGSFLSQVLNELNWFTYAFVAALHQLSRVDLQAMAATTPEKTTRSVQARVPAAAILARR